MNVLRFQHSTSNHHTINLLSDNMHVHTKLIKKSYTEAMFECGVVVHIEQSTCFSVEKT